VFAVRELCELRRSAQRVDAQQRFGGGDAQAHDRRLDGEVDQFRHRRLRAVRSDGDRRALDDFPIAIVEGADQELVGLVGRLRREGFDRGQTLGDVLRLQVARRIGLQTERQEERNDHRVYRSSNHGSALFE
jgi:hypothetical protein